MNITKYRSSNDEVKIFYGKASIIENYVVANADEYCYQYLGNNSCYPFTELIHKDDLPSFLDAVKMLGEGSQSIIVRVKCYNGKYRCLCMTLSYNGRVINGYQSFDINFSDTISIQENYIKYLRTINKYRKFISLIPVFYFEYEIASNIFLIYRYQNSKSIIIFNSNLDELKNKINNSKSFTIDVKNKFLLFYDSLIKGTDYQMEIPAEVFDPEKEGVVFAVKSTPIYKEDSKDMIVGVMKPSNHADKEAYYLSEAARDVGTGLLNKRAISEYCIEKISNSSKDLYLIMMDIDDFKEINDSYGHMYGDEVLTKVSEIILSVLEARGTVGRFGGDEFLILIENVNKEEDLRRILKTINKHIQWAFCDKFHNYEITTSMGVAKYPTDGNSYEELFQKADKCLYIAKGKGKNRYIIYDEARHGEATQSYNKQLIGINTLYNSKERVSVISDIFLNLYSKGAEAIAHSIEVMQVYFDLDGIALYLGNDLKRSYYVGNYRPGFFQFQFFNNPKYKNLFNENHVYAETNIHKIDRDYKEIYNEYLEQDIAEFVQCATYVDEQPQAVISYDVFRRPRKWSEADIDYLSILGKLICDIALKDLIK